ncbi:copper amine oxidase N-terminal domain-containing protein [Eubacteriaceae bacterium ES3]|nr:copper amine oxidase N-terminal domain-containing protein [Eubacteriaceae bacterium ES3]
MKKRLTFLLVLMLAFSMPVMAAPKDKGNNGKKTTVEPPVISAPAVDITEDTTDETDVVDETVVDDTTDEASEQEGKPDKEKPSKPKNDFKQELNEQKKELTQEKSAIAEEKEALEAEYEALLASGDTEAAEALLSQIDELNKSMDALKDQIKTIINERHMVVKTMYTDEELAQFDTAADLIEQMYEDAQALDAGSLTINNQLIKFQAPIYIKGGDVMVPVKALTEKMGAEVLFDEETKTLTITKDSTVITVTTADVEVTIDGEVIDITDQIEVTCGRTYINMEVLSELLGLESSYDEENEIIEIEEPAEEDTDTPVDETADTPADDATDETVDTPADETTDETADSPVEDTPDTSADEDPVTPDLGETL